MRDVIVEKLGRIKDVSDNRMLREVMEEVFLPLVEHTETKYQELERRVREELPLQIEQYNIWTTLAARDRANTHSFLFPMCPEELEQAPRTVAELEEQLKQEGEVRLSTVFVEADYLVCRQLRGSRVVYKGTLPAGEGTVSVGVRLRPAKRYLACVENLYRLFLDNGVPWRTVNAPYLFKLYDICLCRLEPGEIPGNTAVDIEGINADFGEYQAYIQKNLVPMWNVERLHIKGEDFPLPALDRVNYEYHFDLTELGGEHGYLADYGSADIAAVRKEAAALVVTSPRSKGLLWDMYRVVKKVDYATESFSHELMGNGQEESFAGRMTAFYGSSIKTQAELIRLLESYQASEYLRLESYQVVRDAAVGETYEVNAFLKDEIRDQAVSKTLMLRFRARQGSHYLVRDLMSFLTSQVQLVYPEYNCVGVLV